MPGQIPTRQPSLLHAEQRVAACGVESSYPPLAREFYDRPTVDVARELLGKQLVRDGDSGLLRGRIVEVEAYLATGDPACHAARGRNRKNASMFGPPGTSYVYAIHARWCFNVVTESPEVPCAVLIRALEPLEGHASMHARRGVDRTLDLARGPARLCQALDIDRRLDGWDLTRGEALWIAADPAVTPADADIGISGRIGISSAQEIPLRFFLRDVAFVSGPRRLNQ